MFLQTFRAARLFFFDGIYYLLSFYDRMCLSHESRTVRFRAVDSRRTAWKLYSSSLPQNMSQIKKTETEWPNRLAKYEEEVKKIRPSVSYQKEKVFCFKDVGFPGSWICFYDRKWKDSVCYKGCRWSHSQRSK